MNKGNECFTYVSGSDDCYVQKNKVKKDSEMECLHKRLLELCDLLANNAYDIRSGLNKLSARPIAEHEQSIKDPDSELRSMGAIADMNELCSRLDDINIILYTNKEHLNEIIG